MKCKGRVRNESESASASTSASQPLASASSSESASASGTVTQLDSDDCEIVKEYKTAASIKKTIQPYAKDFVKSISSHEIPVNKLKVCEFILGCDIRIGIVSSPHFKNLIEIMNPAFASSCIPSEKEIKDELIGKV